MSRWCVLAVLAASMGLPAYARQAPIERLVSILRPHLDYPAAAPAGDVPANGSADARWFVIWPDGDARRIIVRANPLHPETQRLANDAMAAIQQTIVAAERRAQAEYDRVMEQLRRTGKGADLQGIALDDEGVIGQRIDAELELTIDLESAPQSVDLIAADSPSITVTNGGVAVVRVAPHTYHEDADGTRRERFRPAEARIYAGAAAEPSIARRGPTRHTVTLARAGGWMVVLRGHDGLIDRLVGDADWARLGTTP